MRTFHILKALASEFPITLVAGSEAENAPGANDLRTHGIETIVASVRHAGAVAEGARAVWSRVRRRPYVLFERHNRSAMRRVVSAYCRARKPRLVYLDHLDSAVYRPIFGNTPTLVDLHNVYSLLVKRDAEEPRSRWTAMYLRREAELLARVEHQVVEAVNVAFAVSQREAAYFQALGARSVHVIPNGVDCTSYANLPTGRSARPPVILYVGSMSWTPNVEAVLFLTHAVLPVLRTQFPDIRLRIIGRDPAPAVAALGALRGVEVTGGVPDVRPYLLDATVLAVPLQVGGGTRLKILEAMAAGLPVISSPIGCEGLDVEDGVHLHVTERDGFAAVLGSLLCNDSGRSEIAARAREMVRCRYDWTTIGSDARNVVAALLDETQVQHQ